MNFLKHAPKIAYGLSGLIALAIIILSLTPLSELPAVPGSDKTHHLIAYGALALPTAFAIPRKWLFWGLVYIALGGAIEFIQPYVNRYGEWLDFVANSAGVAIGTGLGIALKRRFETISLS